MKPALWLWGFIFVVLIGPAHASELSMVCFPSNGSPYTVASSGDYVVITSARGVARPYHVERFAPTPHEIGDGVTVNASGGGRILTIMFDKRRGMLMSRRPPSTKQPYDYCSGTTITSQEGSAGSPLGPPPQRAGALPE